jgi:hypothetical protein
MKTFRRMATAAALIGLLAFAGGQPAARGGTLSYLVTVATTDQTGTPGFIEFSMSPSTPSGVTVAASITNYGGDSTPGTISPPIGDVTGSLPGPLTLNNDVYSDYQQALTYGTFIRFDLTISGTDVGNPNAVSGTDFSILLEDSTGMGLNTGTAGAAVDFYFPPLGGTQTVVVSPPATGNTPLVTLSPLSVPEPSSVVLLGLGLGAVVAVGRRRGKARVA